MPAKLVVTARKGGSRISLLGSSGKELLASTVFTEPRAKGATLRALKGLLGEVTIEDHTLSGPGRAKDADAAPVAPRSTPAKAGAKRAAGTTKASKAVKTAAVKAASAPAPTELAIKATAKRRSATKKAAAPVRRSAKKAAVAATPVAKTPAARRQAAARVASNSTTARV